MILGDIFPPPGCTNINAFWDAKKSTHQYSKYVNKQYNSANSDMSRFFDLMKIKWDLQMPSHINNELSSLLETIRQYRCLKGYEFAHKWMEPYTKVFDGLRAQYSPFVRSFYDLYVALHKNHLSNNITLTHEFGKSGRITLTIGEQTYTINWKHTYYGIPIRHEEYIFIDGTQFCQEPHDIKYAENLIHFLRTYHFYTVVVPACVFESHAPKRLEYHLTNGGDFNTWEDIHFPKTEEDLHKQEKRVIIKRQIHLQNTYLLANMKVYKPWTNKQIEEYCSREIPMRSRRKKYNSWSRYGSSSDYTDDDFCNNDDDWYDW